MSVVDKAPVFSFVHSNTRVNVYHVDTGEGIPKHEHIYSHGTFVTSGRLKVTKEGIEVELNKLSQPVSLKANEWHELEALEDGTVFINIFEDGKY